MVEFTRNPGTPQGAETLHSCIIGVGGAGLNVLDRITLDRTMEATLVAMHTDVRVLSHSMAPAKLQLGTDLMRGVGAGGDPDLGREAALFSREEIRKAVDGHQIVFLCVGLGGGSGSGAAPVVAEIAKSTGAMVLVVATVPFAFEGRRRIRQAEEALELLQKRADALVLFENDRMGELILPKDGIQKAFSSADQLISQCLRAVSTMVTTPGLVKLGLDDLTTALSSSEGRCLFGFGEARGQHRGAEALKRALKSPLIDQGRLLHHTKNLLVHVAGGEGLTLVEVEAIMKQVGRNVPDETQILFGVAVDPKLGESVAVTLISSLGADVPTRDAPRPSEPVSRPLTRAEADDLAPPASLRKPTPRPAETRRAAPPPAPEPEPEPELEEPENEQVEETPAAPPPLPQRSAPVEARQEPEPTPSPEVASTDLDLFGQETRAPARREPTPAASTFPDEVELPEPLEDAAEPEVIVEAQEEVVVIEEEVIAADIVEPIPETTAIPVTSRQPEREPEPEPEPPRASPTKPAPNRTLLSSVIQTNGAKAPSDDMFAAGEQDRGRFKDTEPSIVEGEDLDVPTWMRLKKKMKR
ncbi:MAG: hypothetical protein KDK99_20050 [Verrucomicrobiales bacterium]|nr:hypothetical protein [Verrucomicrobiales bacterium]